MINMAGDKSCDKIIREELEEAQIPIIRVYDKNPEVPYTIGGQLFGWELRRQWRYWSATHDVGLPLPCAKQLYSHKDMGIRAGGDCACRPPESWKHDYNVDGFIVIPDPEAEPRENFEKWNLECGKFSWNNDTKYSHVSSYHIDTQKGLMFWADFIKLVQKRMYEAVREW